MTELEVNEEIKEAFQQYHSILVDLKDLYSKIEEQYKNLPSTRKLKIDYEDAVLLSSSCKFESNKAWKMSVQAHESIQVDVDYFTSVLKYEVSEQSLKNKGFDKITDSMRESFVRMNKPLKDLLKASAELLSIRLSLEKNVRGFDNSETSYRKMAEIKAITERF